MADQHKRPDIAALRKLEASLQVHLHDRDAWRRHGDRDLQISPWRLRCGAAYWREHLFHWWLRLRKLTYVAAALAAVVMIAMSALWWRLGSGPIELDLATPWLTAAIEENFGSAHQVEVGGTQLERDANGRTALRIRDIVVRDPDGTIVASAHF